MKHINYLIKPASSLCNLRCRYCFYADEAANRAQESMGVMAPETVEALLGETFRTIAPGGSVSFAFQGGEPTMAGLDYFRYFVRQAHAKCPPKVEMSFSIQTNGTLLDHDWAEFLHSENFLTGLSVDGFKDLHNANRIDAQGKDTWNRVTKALALLQKHHVAVNALCVVTGMCARSPEKAYRQLKKLGFDYIQFIACLDPLGMPRGGMPYSLTPAAYGSFLCRVFDLWYEDWEKGAYHSIRMFDDYVHILLGDGGGTCATCGNCGSYFVVEGDGSVFPCDFYALDEWRLGRFGEDSLAEMAGGERAAAFLVLGREKPPECSGCQWGRVCNGGCKNDWYTADGVAHNYYCAALKKLLDYAAPRLMRIVQAETSVRRNR